MSDRKLVELADFVSEKRLVETACGAIAIPSPTGEEHDIGAYFRDRFLEAGLDVTWQDVEDGRPNVIGTLEGSADGPSLMLNGHMDTSYSGSEPWLKGAGFKPTPVVRNGRIDGLGIANMKGAIACYVEALQALRDARIRLSGDVIVAAVCGEIEKAQWGEAVGKGYRGYGAGTHHLVSHGYVADMCLLGEPTENRMIVAHYGAVWLRLSTTGPFVHTAFSEGRIHENSIVRMRDVLNALLEWIPEWETRTSVDGVRGVASPSAISGGHAWRASRTPRRTDLFVDVRIPPRMSVPEARRELRTLAHELRERFPGYGIQLEFYVSIPGAEIEPQHELVDAVSASHRDIFGTPVEQEVIRWTADSSILAGSGIPTLNYGVASGLPGEYGESVAIDALVDTARVYALTLARVCGVAE